MRTRPAQVAMLGSSASSRKLYRQPTYNCCHNAQSILSKGGRQTEQRSRKIIHQKCSARAASHKKTRRDVKSAAILTREERDITHTHTHTQSCESAAISKPMSNTRQRRCLIYNGDNVEGIYFPHLSHIKPRLVLGKRTNAGLEKTRRAIRQLLAKERHWQWVSMRSKLDKNIDNTHACLRIDDE